MLIGKLGRYCAYRERCQQEVIKKLLDLGAPVEQADDILAELISLGFVNEERFATLYAGGKFRQKRWGRNKIILELRRRNLTEYCIQQGLKEIDEADYYNTLTFLVDRKRKSLTGGNKAENDQKIANFVIQKGYESELVWRVIKKVDTASS